MGTFTDALHAHPPGRQRGSVLVAVMLLTTILTGLIVGVCRPDPRVLLDQVLAGASPAWGVQATGNKPVLRIGKDALVLHVHTSRPGYLLVLQANTDGHTFELIFPNALDEMAQVASGDMVLPRKGWEFKAVGPPGEGTLLVVEQAGAPDEAAIRVAMNKGQLPTLDADYGAARVHWQEVDDTEPAK